MDAGQAFKQPMHPDLNCCSNFAEFLDGQAMELQVVAALIRDGLTSLAMFASILECAQ
jgi:hypothetical protein